MDAGTVVAGRFVVERRAGQGGMSEVFRALDHETGRHVALKVLRATRRTAAERFALESELLSQLSHEGIVQFVAHGITPSGELFLAMEWLEGGDLAQRLESGPLSIDDSLALIRGAAGALGFAHARGIVHRDVKPSNIVLVGGDPGRPKLVDFGIARFRDATNAFTATGTVLGTPGYLAPEQVRGERGVDARADVFALGAVAFECLTGKAAFAGDSPLAILAKIILEDAPPVRSICPGVPEWLDLLVARMLSRESWHRPPDARAVHEYLAATSEPVLTRRVHVVQIDGDASDAPARESITSRRAITGSERTLHSVVLLAARRILGGEALHEGAAERVHPPDAPPLSSAGIPPTHDHAATMVSVDDGGSLALLEDVARRFQATLHVLANGCVLVSVARFGAATDEAATAARCALALWSARPEVAVALATGRAEASTRMQFGEAIDRGAALLERAEAGSVEGVRIDDVTAGLLDSRFDIGGDDVGLLLRGERDTSEVARTLLGRPTPCVGRERELGLLAAVLDECASESVARIVLVSAAAGVGKSRLRAELLRRIEQTGFSGSVWIARGDSLATESSFATIGPAIRHLAGVAESDAAAVRRQKLRARVARHVAEADVQRVTEFLGEISGIAFDDATSPALRAARADAVLHDDQARAAFEDFLAAECAVGEEPVLIVLEDLQWADPPSVRLLHGAFQTLGDRPVMLLVLARPEARARFPMIWDARGLTHVTLSGLSARASADLVRRVLGADTPAPIVERIVERAAGHAFSLEELIRAAAAGPSEQVPDAVLAMVQARLTALEPDVRRVARAASVFGPVFSEAGVAALIGPTALDRTVRARIDELCEREVVSRRTEPGRPIQYVFWSALVRDAAYGMLTDGDRTLGHTLAARWLGAQSSAPAIVAWHWDQAGNAAEALDWHRKAAEDALRANDIDATLAHAARAAACGATGETLGAIRHLQCEAQYIRGNYVGALEHGEHALTLIPYGSLGWCRTAVAVFSSRFNLGRRDDALELARAVSVANIAGDPRRTAFVARMAGTLYYAGARDLAAAITALCAHEDVERQTDLETWAWLWRARATAAIGEADIGRYLECQEHSAAAFVAFGNLRDAAHAHVSIGWALIELGAYERAEVALRAALTEASRRGLPVASADSRQNLGAALLRQGRLTESLQTETEALAAYLEQGDRRMEGCTRIYLAEAYAAAGELGTAEAQAREAVGVLEEAPPQRARALGALCSVLLAQRSVAEAREVAALARSIIDELGAIEEGESQVRLAIVDALRAAGDHAAARDAATTARARVLARAASIADPALRKSFLENVSENARTLALPI